MNTVTADAAIHAALGKFDKPVEIRDADGDVLGYYAPVSRADSRAYSEAAAHFDPEELKRRKESGESGCTTQDLLHRLESIETE